jgi:Uma2 family endonuclease
MSPERWRHGFVKMEAAFALREAMLRAGLDCGAFVDSLTIRIRDDRAFRPAAGVVCPPPPPPDAVVIDNPVVVGEVLSPTTADLDHGIKVQGYFSLASVEHCVILDADRRVAIHHRRGDGDYIETRFVSEGALTLAPPGIEVRVEDLLGPPDAPMCSPLVS